MNRKELSDLYDKFRCYDYDFIKSEVIRIILNDNDFDYLIDNIKEEEIDLITYTICHNDWLNENISGVIKDTIKENKEQGKE